MIYTVTLNPALDRELTVPEIMFDAVLRATALRLDYGGKGFNVSRALAALGEKSVAVGLVGGPTGERFVGGLAEAGIDTDFVRIAGETRTNVSIVSQSQSHHLKVNESGPTISPAETTALLNKVEALAQAGDWWVLSGSLAPGLPATIYAQMIERVQAAGGRVLLDTSGPALGHGCEASPFLAKPNDVEAAELTGLPQPSPETAQAVVEAMLKRGVQNLLISFGKNGALLAAEGDMWLARPPTIAESNPIGAGDALVAGLAWGLQHERPWPDILCQGVACGAAAASLPGTDFGDRALVGRLAEQVQMWQVVVG